jgi:tetratricopeptide (TPR) repeat protein
MVALFPGIAAADWVSLTSPHFRVIGNTGERDVRSVALKLEQFRDVIRQLNAAALREDNAPPVTVLVFKDRASYEPFMPRSNGRVIPVGGFFQPGQDANYITLNVDSGNQALRTIFHEYTHLLLRGVFGDAPVWFNEGLAEYYSTFEVIGNRKADIGKAVQSHLDLLRSRRLPFGRFFAIERNSPEYTRDITERDVLYAQSWAIVHHAFHGESKRGAQLLAFVTKLAEGRPTLESFREAYGIEISDLEQEVQLYVQRTTQDFFQYTFPDSIVARIDAPATKITDAEADAWLGDLLVHMNRQEDAAARLEKAIAAKPDLSLAHASLGVLQLRQGKTSDGMAHLKQAVALGGAPEFAYFSYAAGLIGGGNADPSVLAEASRALERAVALRPGYTEAKLLLGYAYAASDRLAAARELLLRLVQSEPNNHRAALRLAQVLLQLNELANARAIAGPVLARSTDESERNQARRVLELSAGMTTRTEAREAAGRPMDAGAPTLDPPPVVAAPVTPTPPTVPRPASSVPALRVVKAGEERVYGVFEAVECPTNSVVLVVRTQAGVVRAAAASFSAIDFVTYRSLNSTSIPCGAQTRVEVYLTLRRASAGSAEGTAVALEVLPEGFVPVR